MERYERPEILASYTVEELVQEAVVCMAYGGGGSNSGHGSGGNRGHGYGLISGPGGGGNSGGKKGGGGKP